MTDEYLTIAELATCLKISPKTVRNKMAANAFREGVHYFRPPGMQPRFKWAAIVQWIEQDRAPAAGNESIPMPRHYRQRENQKSVS